MLKPGKTILTAAAAFCLLAIVSMTACNDEKKTSTESTISDTLVTPIDSPSLMAPDTSNMNRMDTGETKPIVPGT